MPPRNGAIASKVNSDQGWEKVREETYQLQLEMGIIPPDTRLTPHPEWVQSWDSLSDGEKVDIDLHPSNLSEEDLQILRETEAAYASFKE